MAIPCFGGGFLESWVTEEQKWKTAHILYNKVPNDRYCNIKNCVVYYTVDNPPV